MENERNAGGIISCRFKRIDSKVLIFCSAFSSCRDDNGSGGIYPSYKCVNQVTYYTREQKVLHLGAKMPCHSKAPQELSSGLG